MARKFGMCVYLSCLYTLFCFCVKSNSFLSNVSLWETHQDTKQIGFILRILLLIPAALAWELVVYTVSALLWGAFLKDPNIACGALALFGWAVCVLRIIRTYSREGFALFAFKRKTGRRRVWVCSVETQHLHNANFACFYTCAITSANINNMPLSLKGFK